MVSSASVNKEDIVLEVGAGLGFLTELLSHQCKQVVAVEIDPRLVQILKGQLQFSSNIELIHGDILKVPIPPFNKVVSTPPYSISSPILFWLLERKFDCAVLTFQEEFAKRLNAPVGSGDYCRLTVNTYYQTEVELLDRISKEMFYPQPTVDSMIVRLKPKENPPFPVQDEKTFQKLVRVLFTQRNRKLRNAILPFLYSQGAPRKKAKQIARSLIFHDRRVRKLTPEDFGRLSNALT
jgi:16S rRNA (adenine1518-N6/adenine1519-N6)-dimethyltransferase